MHRAIKEAVHGTARERILRAAAHLYAVHGFRGTSLREVAEAAGVTKPLVLYHFETMPKLYSTLLREAIDRCRHEAEAALEAPGSVAERLRRLLEVQVAQAREAPEVACFAYEVISMPEQLPLDFDYRDEGRQIFQTYVRLIEEGQARGEFRQMDAQTAATVPFGALRLYVSAVLAGDLERLPDDLAGTLFDLLMKGVEANRS